MTRRQIFIWQNRSPCIVLYSTNGCGQGSRCDYIVSKIGGSHRPRVTLRHGQPTTTQARLANKVRQKIALHYSPFDHHDTLESRNGETHNGDHVEELLTFDEVIAELRRFDKAIKVDLKEGSEAVTFVLEALAERDFGESRTWFNANIEVLGEDGFRQLRRARPQAIVQCPIDHLISQITDSPDGARATLEELRRL